MNTHLRLLLLVSILGLSSCFKTSPVNQRNLSAISGGEQNAEATSDATVGNPSTSIPAESETSGIRGVTATQLGWSGSAFGSTNKFYVVPVE